MFKSQAQMSGSIKDWIYVFKIWHSLFSYLPSQTSYISRSSPDLMVWLTYFWMQHLQISVKYINLARSLK